jgi:hypothetical protein
VHCRLVLSVWLIVAVATAVAAAAQTPATDPAPELAANPGRPTVSAPATLTAVGYLQFENGLTLATTSAEFARRLGLNQVTKLAVHDRAQIILQFEPVVRSVSGGATAVQAGGIGAGVQVVLVPGAGARPTVAASYVRSVYGGSAPDIDIGSATDSVTFLASSDFAAFHVDVNAIVNRQSSGPIVRAQFGQTLSVSHPLGPATVAAELWHFSQPLTGGDCAGSLWALSYAIHPTLVVDAGFNRGLTRQSTRWEFFAGFTYLVAHRVWK